MRDGGERNHEDGNYSKAAGTNQLAAGDESAAAVRMLTLAGKFDLPKQRLSECKLTVHITTAQAS